MRYYLIQLSQNGTLIRQWTSNPNGRPDPGALNIIIDAYVAPYATPQSLSVLQIWGVSLQDIAQANNFKDCTIKVFAGFQKGLPLNNPAQAGLILAGSVWQAFGNWQGTDMTLDFVIAPQGALAAQESNIVLSWKAGTPLATALAATFNTAFPGFKQTIQVSPNLVLAHDETGVYPSLIPFAQTLKPLTAAAIGGAYPGVDIVVRPDGIVVFDGTTQASPAQIAFQDLIGQPTWIGPSTIQFACPMRADLSVNDYVQMPKSILGSSANPAGVPGAVTTTQAAYPSTRDSSAFTGVFFVRQVHQMGNFRQPDGMSWITVFDADVRQRST